MKKSTYLLLLLFSMVITYVRANIIMPENILTMKVQLSNLDEFPDLEIVAYDIGAFPSDKKYSIVKDETLAITQKPKTAILKMSHALGKRAIFYVLKKDYLEKVGIDNINWETDRNVQRLNVETGQALAVSDIYSDIKVELKLAKKNNTYYVYKSKVTGKLKAKGNQQAAADIVKTYKDDVVDPLEPMYISEEIL